MPLVSLQSIHHNVMGMQHIHDSIFSYLPWETASLVDEQSRYRMELAFRACAPGLHQITAYGDAFRAWRDRWTCISVDEIELTFEVSLQRPTARVLWCHFTDPNLDQLANFEASVGR